jgi:hypothetical protein
MLLVFIQNVEILRDQIVDWRKTKFLLIQLEVWIIDFIKKLRAKVSGVVFGPIPILLLIGLLLY